MKKTHKGFTLVELLIVIVVIGILSAMMMMSSNEAVTTAKANNIISNLRNLKTAGMAYYTDNMDVDWLTKTDDEIKEGIVKYLGGKAEIPDIKDYFFFRKDGQWYIGYTINKNAKTGSLEIRKKLLGRAKAIGLLDVNRGKNQIKPFQTWAGDGTPGEYPAVRIR